MEAEIVPGDIILVEKNNGAGLTVRYYLPRKKNSVVPTMPQHRNGQLVSFRRR
jgi:hypothetical protein